MSSLRGKIRKHRRRSSSYESLMRTLLLQNQQVIIQQQNMMMMLIRQHYPDIPPVSAPSTDVLNTLIAHHQPQQQHQSQHQDRQQPPPQQEQPQQQSQQSQQQQQPQSHQQSHQQQHHNQIHLDDTLSALLESDGLMTNNLLYNPNTDIGSITPYKAHIQDQDHHESPPYYSSESLTTPRVEHRPQTTINVAQNVVKNLNDSFKSPTKPAKINVQILSGSATREIRNNKAKIIQSMNISEFLRTVHQDEK